VAANTPTTLRLLLEQPQDEHETSDEIGLQSALCKLSGGHINISNISSNQQVGTVVVRSSYTGGKSTNLLVYVGQETTGSQRHVFKEVTSLSSSFVLARLFYSEDAAGVTLEASGGDRIFQLNPGIAYEFQFTAPIFTPIGNAVGLRLEAVSKPFTSIPGNEMRVIWNSIQRGP